MIFLYVKVAVIAVFVCFFGDVVCMEADAEFAPLRSIHGDGNGAAKSERKLPARSYSSLRDEVPEQQDLKDLEQAIIKMLNLSDGETEFYYSVLAIINPGSGTQDPRIQKYVRKWCIKPEHQKWVTEQRVGQGVAYVCKNKNINLNRVLTLAISLGDIHVARVMLAAGVMTSDLDRRYMQQWASMESLDCWKKLLQKPDEGKHE